jgi:hypothetical protein
MNPYSVEWLPEVLDDLADIWMRAADRHAVTVAQATIDRLLAQSPETMGHLLAEDLWRINVPPLWVTYTIDDVAHRIQVDSVWSNS